MTSNRTAKIVSLLAVLVIPSTASAYEAATTHAGITEQAAYASDLHDWLRKGWALDRGLWQRLSLRPKRMKPERRWIFVRDLFTLNPAHGYTPTAQLVGRALSWLKAGSVLEAVPSSRIRHHFLDGRTGKGLHQKAGRKWLAWKIRFWDYLYGGGTLAGAMTGANFDLTGKSALQWAHAPSNRYGLRSHWRHRREAVAARSPNERLHELAMSLVTMGALAHLLQNMACPSYVRNDFIVSHLRKDGAVGETPYARYVARQLGRSGIPKLTGKRVRRYRFDALFYNPEGTGLAQTTARSYFSPGSLPEPVEAEPKKAKKHLQAFAEKWPRPVLQPIDWKLEEGQTRYIRRKHTSVGFGSIRVAAYGVSPTGLLRFWLERRVYGDYAAELLPRAVRYTEALIAYLLRGRLALSTKKGDEAAGSIAVENDGVPLSSGRLVVMSQDAKGVRTAVLEKKLSASIAAGGLISTVPRSKLGPDAQGVAVLFEGKDAKGERIVASGFAPLSAFGPSK
jgi:hypothetical protein